MLLSRIFLDHYISVALKEDVRKKKVNVTKFFYVSTKKFAVSIKNFGNLFLVNFMEENGRSFTI